MICRARSGRRPAIATRVAAELRSLLEDGPVDPEVRTRIAVALLPSEPSRAAELADRLLACGPEEHRAIREALRPHRADIAGRLLAALVADTSDPGRRARAAAALIAFDGPDPPGPFADAAPAWARLRAAEVPDLRVELLDWLVRSRIRPETSPTASDASPTHPPAAP